MNEHEVDHADEALRGLGRQLETTIVELHTTLERVEQLARLRGSGHSWYDIVSQEEPPLIVETLTRVLDDLGAVGGRFRREEALALQRENISINRISQLFGVTRQRVSALVRARPDPADGRGTGSRP